MAMEVCDGSADGGEAEVREGEREWVADASPAGCLYSSALWMNELYVV